MSLGEIVDCNLKNVVVGCHYNNFVVVFDKVVYSIIVKVIYDLSIIVIDLNIVAFCSQIPILKFVLILLPLIGSLNNTVTHLKFKWFLYVSKCLRMGYFFENFP